MNKWLCGIMGLVVGDALGVPVQFMDREEIANRVEGPVSGMESGGVFNMPAGTWSDDSSMAIATMASILEHGTLIPDEVMKNFVKWETKGEFTPFGKAFDQGNTCLESIYKYIETGDYKTCGKTGEHANGNGALMRIMPACLYYYERQEQTEEDISEDIIHGIEDISALTHNHLRSKIACGLYYYMVREIIRSKTADDGRRLIDILQVGINHGLGHYGKDKNNLIEMAHYGRLFYLNELLQTPEEDIYSSGYVVDSIEAAVWCLVSTESYGECILKAVNLGDDTDTVAAIAGGLAGLYYGVENIPTEWLEVIERREWIEKMCGEMDEESSCSDGAC